MLGANNTALYASGRIRDITGTPWTKKENKELLEGGTPEEIRARYNGNNEVIEEEVVELTEEQKKELAEKEAEKILKEKENAEKEAEVQVVRDAYRAALGKDVSNNKKNDVEWMNTKIKEASEKQGEEK